MPVLKTIYEKQEDIPEPYKELFAEKTDPETKKTQWEMTEVEGVKTQADVDRVTQALGHEKANHKKTKDALDKWNDMDPEQALKDLEELDELRVRVEAGEGKELDEEKMGKIVEARVKTETAPMQRKLEESEAENETLRGDNTTLRQEKTNRIISDAVRKAATADKIVSTALDDVLMYGEQVFEITEDNRVVTKDNVGFVPGLTPEIWLSDMKDKRPHWWPVSQGGGANGSGQGSGFADNPFTHDNWNLTEQGKIQRADPEKAARMAKTAGTSVGGLQPPAPSK
jgi:hypothetical protein